MSARFFLKAETAEAHERLDAHFAQYDLSNADDYRRFLTAHAAAFLPLEAAVEKAGIAAKIPNWPGQRRADALQQDLALLNCAVPQMLTVPAIQCDAELFGSAYVLEGSRLGATLLCRQVDISLPTNFLGHTPVFSWKNFVALLERTLYSLDKQERAARAANTAFSLFEDAAHLY